MPARTPEEVHALFQKAVATMDAAALASLYEPGAVYLPDPNQAITGRDAIEQTFAALGAAITDSSIDLERAKMFRIGEDLAVVYGSWTLRGKAPDGPFEVSGRSVEVLRRQPDGTWLYAFDDGNGRTS